MSTPRSIPALPYPVEANITLPGSKSIANRALICAALADGETIIRNATPCDDVSMMVDGLSAMGFDIRWLDRMAGIIEVRGKRSAISDQRSAISDQPACRHQTAILDCHNAGTTLRFLTSLACIIPGDWIITGNEHMRRRPIKDLVNALRSLGADIEDTNGCPPIRIKGGTLHGGHVKLKATISSQFLTSLLLVAPMLKEGLAIELDGPLASSGYVDLTKKVMADFGVKIKQEGSRFIVGSVYPQVGNLLPIQHILTNNLGSRIPSRGVTGYHPHHSGYAIEGDWSAAGVWLVLNALTGSRIHCTNLDYSSAQSDRQIIDAIGKLKGSDDITINALQIPDQVMNLAVLAAFRQGKTIITGAKNLRVKECDRLAVTVENFRKLDIHIKEHPDGLIISGQQRANSQKLIANSLVLDPHADHRMVISFAALGLLLGNVSISNPECVAKSYPDFFSDLALILKSPRPIIIVGMRGVGKSSLGRRLASKLKLKHLDSDHLFEKRHGNIKDFVKSKGWAAFRSGEESIIADALEPGIVFSLGGGATESAKTRALLLDRAIVIWLQADDRELIKRLKTGKRPPLTDLPLAEEVAKFQRERAPHYDEVASIIVGPKVRFSAQVSLVISELRKLVNPQEGMDSTSSPQCLLPSAKNKLPIQKGHCTSVQGSGFPTRGAERKNSYNHSQ